MNELPQRVWKIIAVGKSMDGKKYFISIQQIIPKIEKVQELKDYSGRDWHKGDFIIDLPFIQRASPLQTLMIRKFLKQ